mgnify:CR=1 FL=1
MAKKLKEARKLINKSIDESTRLKPTQYQFKPNGIRYALDQPFAIRKGLIKGEPKLYEKELFSPGYKKVAEGSDVRKMLYEDAQKKIHDFDDRLVEHLKNKNLILIP